MALAEQSSSAELLRALSEDVADFMNTPCIPEERPFQEGLSFITPTSALVEGVVSETLKWNVGVDFGDFYWDPDAPPDDSPPAEVDAEAPVVTRELDEHWPTWRYAFETFVRGYGKFSAVAFVGAPRSEQAKFLALLEMPLSGLTFDGAPVVNFRQIDAHPRDEEPRSAALRLCRPVTAFSRLLAVVAARDRRRRWLSLRIACFVLMLQSSAVKRVFDPAVYAPTLRREFKDLII